jgi:(p)ppGpp synthase/HD superfamily hydrolase
MLLRPIPEEREDKIRSLLTDRVALEREGFKAALVALSVPLPPQSLRKIEEAQDFNLSQDYGPGPRNRFYGVHPVRVARFVAQSLDPVGVHFTEALVAALVHNGVEKGILSIQQLEARFGPWVAKAVEVLTPDRVKLQTAEGMRKYYEGIRLEGREVQVLKCLDKFDNIFSLCLNPDENVRKNYLEEIRSYVSPMVREQLPSISEYFEDLVADAEKLGHWKPSWA